MASPKALTALRRWYGLLLLWARDVLVIAAAISILWVVPLAAWPGLFLAMLGFEALRDFFRKRR